MTNFCLITYLGSKEEIDDDTDEEVDDEIDDLDNKDQGKINVFFLQECINWKYWKKIEIFYSI